MRAMTFKAIERYAKLVQNLAIIFGIFTGVISLFAAQYDRRVAKTVDMTKLYTDKVRADYMELIVNWDNYTKPITNFFELEEAEMKKTVLAFFDQDKNQKLIRNYLDFYDVLGGCLGSRACDRNSALEFLKPSARVAYEIAGFYVEERRHADRDEAYGIGLEKFYRMKRECFIVRYL